MKKITFILFALITGTAFAQPESATATVNAAIVTPIAIEDGSALNFGSIVAADGGIVTVDTDNARSFSNDKMKVTTATTITAASFKVTAADQYSYSISIPDIQLTGTGDAAMAVKFTQNLDGEIDGTATGLGTEQTLKVGGILTVADGQTEGAYDGEVTVTVAYE